MTSNPRFLFGPFGAVLLVVGVVGLALMVPGYDPVRQTVSEIGEVGSPMQLPFTLLLCVVAVCILVFAWTLRDASIAAGRSATAAYVAGVMALSAAGVGVFSYPHPLHNVFGLSELVGYQAPLVFALTWRRESSAKAVVGFSGIMSAVVWLTIILNLTTFDRQGAVWAHIKPVYGLIQRALFAAWFTWCAGAGVMFFQRSRRGTA
jgi:hypothetical membrane protein